MREDLAKCTTERGRVGAKGKCFKTKYRGKVKIHPDTDHEYLNEYGGFRSSARHRHWESKSLTDVLNPLIGNIRKNLGRPWDKVYSEFCQVLDRRGVSGYHIWTHLMQEVITNTFLEEGKIYEISRFGNSSEVSGFYVHPITKLLRYKEPDRSWRHQRKQTKPPELAVPGLDGWTYEQFDEIWFRCKAEKQEPLYENDYYPYVNFKRQASKKEISWIKAQLGQ